MLLWLLNIIDYLFSMLEMQLLFLTLDWFHFLLQVEYCFKFVEFCFSRF